MVRQFANSWDKSNKASAALNSLPVCHDNNHYKSLSVPNTPISMQLTGETDSM